MTGPSRPGRVVGPHRFTPWPCHLNSNSGDILDIVRVFNTRPTTRSRVLYIVMVGWTCKTWRLSVTSSPDGFHLRTLFGMDPNTSSSHHHHASLLNSSIKQVTWVGGMAGIEPAPSKSNDCTRLSPCQLGHGGGHLPGTYHLFSLRMFFYLLFLSGITAHGYHHVN